MECHFKVISVLVVDHNPGIKKSKHKHTMFNLELSDNLDKPRYFDKEGLANKEGSQLITAVLVESLIGNIHMAQQKGYRNDVEHLKHIIAELERGFASNVNIGTKRQIT